MEQVEQSIPSTTELMPVMGFTPDDIEANREGQLGEQQIYHLRVLKRRALTIGAAGFFGIGLLAATFIYFAQVNESFILQLIGIFMTLINAIFVGMNGRHWMLLNADIRGAEVEAVSGELERVVQADSRMNNLVLRVDGNDFHVKKEVFKHFRHEVHYTIYRTPYAKILLAAEPTP